LILVDDHSPDECGKSVKKWMHQKNLESAKQIHVIINEQNIGVAESRNIGIKSSIGQFICTLDADDIISAEYFALAFGAILNNPEVSIVFSNLKLFGEKDGDWTPPEWDLLSSLTTGPLSSMTIFRRNLWESAEGVSSALPRSNEDYDFWLKLVELGPIAIRLDGFHTFYRYKSKSRMRDTMKYYAEEHAMMRIRHPILYHPEALLRDHELISHMLPGTREILESRINSNAFFNQEDKISTLLWLSFPYLHLNDFEKVEKILSQIEDEVKNPDVHPRILWQFNYQRVKMLCRLGKHSESISLLNSLLDSFPVLRFAPNIYSNIAACKSALL
jgi:glycosyltransferase involved in cell wall biosynthesis